jgi:hypothetical protein
MVTRLFPAPEGLIAVCGTEEELFPEEVPILALALHDNGEITGVAWSEKQKRFWPDVSDEIFFPNFVRVMFAEDDLDEEEQAEEDSDGIE